MTITLIALGGALGTLARWWLMVLFPTPAGGIPWATLAINVAGSLLLGFFMRTFTTHPGTSPAIAGALTVGLCGGFTTFSTFSAELWRLVDGGDWTRAAVYAVASVLISLLAVAAGIGLARVVRAG